MARRRAENERARALVQLKLGRDRLQRAAAEADAYRLGLENE
jgi:hypothetical protein